jgi:hypothetical protein
MRRAAAVAEGSPAGIRVAGDSRAAGDNPEEVEDIREAAVDIRVVEDTPAVAADSTRRVEAGSRAAAADTRAGEDIREAAVDTRVAAEDSPAGILVAGDSPVVADSPVAGEDNIPSAAACRRTSYRTWRKKYCRGLPESRN